jgi:hypothetical protein
VCILIYYSHRHQVVLSEHITITGDQASQLDGAANYAGNLGNTARRAGYYRWISAGATSAFMFCMQSASQ